MARGFLIGAAAAAGLLVAGALPAAPARAPAAKAAPAARDWTRTIVATAEGGFRVGNPAAPVKLVEYGSFTCNHCANFAREGMPALLAGYVKSGRVSFEFRNFVRDPFDLTAALLARCGTPATGLALTEDYFASQEQWIARYTAMSQAEMDALNALPEGERPWRIATAGGLDAIAAKAGVPAAKAKQCVGDSAAVRSLVEVRQKAVDQHKVSGTPSFLINGRLVEAHDWHALQPLLGPPVG